MKNVEDIYPLSALQQGLLIEGILSPNSGLNCQQMVISIEGELDAPAYIRSWQYLVKRHSVLRTAFVWEGLDEPVQVVHREALLNVEQEDWRPLSASAQRDKLAGYLSSVQNKEFDLSKPPMMRMVLARLSDKQHQLIWSCHHLLLDGWSVSLILDELNTCYQALHNGSEIQLQNPRPFRDYIKWQRQQSRSEAETFWRAQLNDFIAPTRIGSETPSVPGPSTEALRGFQRVSLPESSALALQAFARQHHLTLNTLIHGAWGVLLSRYTNEEDVVFGSVVSGRTANVEGVESMVGDLTNALPARLKPAGESLVVPWLTRLQKQLAEMRQYDYLSLSQIQKWSGISQGQGLFQSLLVFQNYPRGASSQKLDSSLKSERSYSSLITSSPLFVSVVPDRELTLNVSYDRSLLRDASIERLLGHFRILLEGMAAKSDQRLDDLPLLSPEERKVQLVDWNQTRVEYPKNRCLHELIEEQADRAAEAVGVVFGDKKLTYRQLNERGNQLARHLQKLGVGPDTLVGICVERSLEMVVGLLGILKAGGAYVPMDPEYPKDRLAFMLEDAAVPVLLTQGAIEPSLPPHRARIVRLDADWPAIGIESSANLRSAMAAHHLAYMIYTSGSTGKPKGVQIQHRSVVNFLHSMRAAPGLTAQDKLLAITTLSFDIAGLELWLPLMVGAQIVLTSRETARDALALGELLARCQATVMQATPSTWKMLLSSEWKGSPRLKILCGGEPWPKDLARQLLQKCGSLWNMYGPTETTIWSAACRINPGEEVLIGGPIANTQLYVLNRHLQPAPVGVAGELYIGGDGLARGYLHRPELTGERFVRDPFAGHPAARMYRTGDLVRWQADGKIEFLGRTDHQVKIRGFRIELGEIESGLTAHAGVREAVVVAREDVPGDQRLVAYVTAKNGRPPADSELRGLLQAKLPDYMVPSAFVVLERFPLTPNGKVDRKSLPAPDLKRPDSENSYVAPQNGTEERLARIWCEILGLKQVGTRDDFFDLGGHSLLVVRLQARVAKELGRKISLATFFHAATIAEQAALLLEPGDAAVNSRVLTFRPGRTGNPLFLIHDVEFSRPLSVRFPASRPVHFIDSAYEDAFAVWDKTGRVETSLEDLASRCLEDLRSVQAEGPYCLAGFCFAGIVAFEIAQRLAAQGEQVAFLGLIDSSYPPGTKVGFMIRLKILAFHLRNTWKLGPGYLARRLRDRWIMLRERMKQTKPRPAGNRPAGPTDNPEPTEAENEYWRRAMFRRGLGIAYRSEGYAGAAHLFRAVGEPHPLNRAFAFNGWDRVVQGGLKIENFDCGHGDLRREPYVSDLANKIESCLCRVDAETRPKPARESLRVA